MTPILWLTQSEIFYEFHAPHGAILSTVFIARMHFRINYLCHSCRYSLTIKLLLSYSV